MRILQIANYKEGVGGITIQVKRLTDNLRQEGIECDVLSTKGSLFNRLKAVVSLVCKGRRYDVFHVHCCSYRGFFPALVGVSIGRVLKKRIILTYHGGEADGFFKKRARLVRDILSKTSANIVLSGFIGDIFDRYNIPYVIIPNIIGFRQSGVGPDGRVVGELRATGSVPTWIDRVRSSGIEVDMGMFGG